jgi:hypothetical protein
VAQGPPKRGAGEAQAWIQESALLATKVEKMAGWGGRLDRTRPKANFTSLLSQTDAEREQKRRIQVSTTERMTESKLRSMTNWNQQSYLPVNRQAGY